ncbi:heterokaryon incompatibility protein-domain-containing protein [Xylariales sp. PMI_506]|nr:heterokaryon incompatibility protein-domain-containing protein [Xylariales sp. PMI_506]
MAGYRHERDSRPPSTAAASSRALALPEPRGKGWSLRQASMERVAASIVAGVPYNQRRTFRFQLPEGTISGEFVVEPRSRQIENAPRPGDKYLSPSLSLARKPSYRKLSISGGEIRLLRVIDAAPGSIVRCTVKHFDINSPETQYCALSYHWGSKAMSEEIHIDGRRSTVSSTLVSFLREAWEQGVGYLWIDQVCIDQCNQNEVSEQVKIMDQIYRRASKVIIWLGSGLSPKGLLSKHYWDRLWIVQEVLLARHREVWYGSSQYSWESVQALADGYCQHPGMELGHTIERLLWPEETNKHSLLKALWFFSENQTSRPRDKIYGLMGIVRQDQRITIDYNKADREIFADALRMIRAVHRNYDGLIAELGTADNVKQAQGTLSGVGSIMQVPIDEVSRHLQIFQPPASKLTRNHHNHLLEQRVYEYNDYNHGHLTTQQDRTRASRHNLYLADSNTRFHHVEDPGNRDDYFKVPVRILHPADKPSSDISSRRWERQVVDPNSRYYADRRVPSAYHGRS